jgi:hypothetical protein
VQNGVPVVDRYEGGRCNEWCGWYGNPWIETGKVCQVWGNWRKSHGGSARIRFQYRERTDTVVQTDRSLRMVTKAGAGAAEVERLEFGRLYEAELSPEYASYNLVLQLFNGEEVVLTPDFEVNGDLARANLEFLGGTTNRLLITLGGV